jgi:hypothetical protein
LCLLVGLAIAGLEVGMGEPAGKGQLGEHGVEIHGTRARLPPGREDGEGGARCGTSAHRWMSG